MNNIEKTLLLLGTTIVLAGCGSKEETTDPAIKDPVVTDPVVVVGTTLDFENDTGTYTLLGDSNGSAMIEEGPLSATNKALKVVVTAGYSAGVTMPITIPEGKTLADYSAVSFKVYYTEDGTADIDNKRIQILAVSELPDSVALIQYNGTWAEDATEGHLGVMDNAKADKLESTAFQTYTFDLTDGNVADLVEGSGSTLAAATKALTGTVNLIFGFPHSDSTYYIDDLTFVMAEDVVTPDTDIVVDFEADSTSSTLVGDGSATVMVDPTDATKKALKVTTNGGYGAGVAIPVSIPAGKTLADYSAATFKVFYTAEGDADIDNKRIQIFAHSDVPETISLIQYDGTWADNATDAHLGVMDNAKGDKTASTAFQTYTFDLTDGNLAALEATASLATETKALTGDITLVVAFPHSGSVYYVDDLTLVLAK